MQQLVRRSKCVTEVRVKHSTVRVLVVSANDEVDFILVWVGSELIQSLMHFWSCDPSLAVLINHLESIHQVKVLSLSEPTLGILKLLFESHLLLECTDELFLLIKLQVRSLREMLLVSILIFSGRWNKGILTDCVELGCSGSKLFLVIVILHE